MSKNEEKKGRKEERARPRAEEGGGRASGSHSTDKLTSLHQLYGKRPSLVQCLSILINIGMLLYGHFGLFCVFVSNQQLISDALEASDPLTASTSNNGACLATDHERWTRVGGQNFTNETDFCTTGEPLCFLGVPCLTDCFMDHFNYSEPCASCFAQAPQCTIFKGCAVICANGPFSLECTICNQECRDTFANCSGFDVALTFPNNTIPGSVATKAPEWDTTIDTAESDICKVQQEGVNIRDVETFYTAFEIVLFDIIGTTWNGGARLLAVTGFVFSGFWPYAKNLLLLIAWFIPMGTSRRSDILKWVRRLAKYSLVVVFGFYVVIIAAMLRIDIAGLPVLVRGEPRSALHVFFIATVWQSVHLEWMLSRHRLHLGAAVPCQHSLPSQHNLMSHLTFESPRRTNVYCRNATLARGLMCLLVAASLGLYFVGALLDLVRFEWTYAGDTEGCELSYNLYSLGTTLVEDFFLYRSNVNAGIWFMYLSYIFSMAILPLCTHVIHALALFFNYSDRNLFRAVDLGWTFAGVEVLLIGVFVTQYELSNLLTALSGLEASAQLVGVEATLGPGFFLLIVYCIVAGLLHYFFYSAVTEYYQSDPHYKVDSCWAMVLGCLLTSRPDSVGEICSTEQAMISYDGAEETKC